MDQVLGWIDTVGSGSDSLNVAESLESSFRQVVDVVRILTGLTAC